MAGLTAPQKRPGPIPPARKTVPSISNAKPAASTAEQTAARIQTRADGLIGLAQIGSFLCTIRGQFANVGTINAYAETTCLELAAVGEENALIGKGLDMLAAAGPYTKLLTVALPFGMQLLANAGRMDWKMAQKLGVIDPQIMANKAVADIERMAREAQEQAEVEAKMQAQQRAERERQTDDRNQPAYA